MYYYLLSSLKRRLVLELQDSFSKHPVYEKIVPFIQNKYAFDERPKFGIVIKGASGNKVQFSAENFMGTVQSHVMLAYLDKPAYMLEWIREDLNVVRDNEGRMPISAGIYYIECLTAPTMNGEVGTFVIDPLLTVTDEPLLKVVSGVETNAQLVNEPAEGTLRLWENRRIPLMLGTDYELGDRGIIRFLVNLLPGSIITADYRYSVPSIGPIEWKWNTSDWKTLPGVVLAFGKRGKAGDKQVVVVYEDRVDTANAYGGKFAMSFDMDVIAQDPIQMEEIADFAVMSLWGEKRSALSFEGIEITDMSIGGETEETYDENADTFYYNASLSLQVQADWEIHNPLPFTIHRVTTATRADDTSLVSGQESGLKMQSYGNRLFFATYPIIVGRNNNYERIS